MAETLNPAQIRVLELLLEYPEKVSNERDLYEGAGAGKNKGSGFYWLSWTATDPYQPLSADEVRELHEQGLIVEKWPGCYTVERDAAKFAIVRAAASRAKEKA